MKLNGELLEQLAGAYALGSLQGGARRRLEAMARQLPEVREAVTRWQQQLAGLTELVPPVEPPLGLWRRIEGVLRADLALRGEALPQATPVPVAKPGRGLALGWGWMSGALGLGLAVALAWGWQQYEGRGRDANRLREQLVAQSSALDQARAELAAQASIARVGYVAVLADPKSGPALLVTFDPVSRQLGVKRVGSYQEAQEKSLQLWTIAPGQAPKSLGVLSRETRERLRAEAVDDVSEPRVLAISLEPLGGVPSERGPTGPVLFTGPVLKTDV